MTWHQAIKPTNGYARATNSIAELPRVWVCRLLVEALDRTGMRLFDVKMDFHYLLELQH